MTRATTTSAATGSPLIRHAESRPHGRGGHAVYRLLRAAGLRRVAGGPDDRLLSDPRGRGRQHQGRAIRFLHPDEITMAEVLKARGYAHRPGRQVAPGRSGKANEAVAPDRIDPSLMPNAQGFDYFFGTPAAQRIHPRGRPQDVQITELMRNDEVLESPDRHGPAHAAIHGRGGPVHPREHRTGRSSSTWPTTCRTCRLGRRRVPRQVAGGASTAT